MQCSTLGGKNEKVKKPTCIKSGVHEEREGLVVCFCAPASRELWAGAPARPEAVRGRAPGPSSGAVPAGNAPGALGRALAAGRGRARCSRAAAVGHELLPACRWDGGERAGGRDEQCPSHLHFAHYSPPGSSEIAQGLDCRRRFGFVFLVLPKP